MVAPNLSCLRCVFLQTFSPIRRPVYERDRVFYTTYVRRRAYRTTSTCPGGKGLKITKHWDRSTTTTITDRPNINKCKTRKFIMSSLSPPLATDLYQYNNIHWIQYTCDRRFFFLHFLLLLLLIFIIIIINNPV